MSFNETNEDDPLKAAMNEFQGTVKDSSESYSQFREELATDQDEVEKALKSKFLVKDAPSLQQGLQLTNLISPNFFGRLFKKGSLHEFPVVIVNRSTKDCVLSVFDSANPAFQISSEHSVSGGGGPTSATGTFVAKSTHTLADRVNAASVKTLKGSHPQKLPTYSVFYIPSTSECLYVTIAVISTPSASASGSGSGVGVQAHEYHVLTYRETVGKNQWYLIDEPLIPLETLPSLDEFVKKSCQIVALKHAKE